MYVHVRVTITTWWYYWVVWSWKINLVLCSYVYISPTSNYHDYHVINWDAHPRKKLMGMGLSLLLSTNAIDSFGRENIRSSIHESASWTNMEAKANKCLTCASSNDIHSNPCIGPLDRPDLFLENHPSQADECVEAPPHWYLSQILAHKDWMVTIWLFNIAMVTIPHKWRFLAGKIIYFYGPSIPWLC